MRVSYADQVREYARRHYIEPARKRQESEVEIVAGDIHRELHFTNRFPIVCQALTARKFLTENRLTIEKREGPPKGLGARVKIKYRLLPEVAPSEADADPLMGLYGIFKGLFPPGEWEASIRRDRENFYGPVEDE